MKLHLLVFSILCLTALLTLSGCTEGTVVPPFTLGQLVNQVYEEDGVTRATYTKFMNGDYNALCIAQVDVNRLRLYDCNSGGGGTPVTDYLKYIGGTIFDVNTSSFEGKFLRDDGNWAEVTSGEVDTNVYTAGVMSPDNNSFLIDVNAGTNNIYGNTVYTDTVYARTAPYEIIKYFSPTEIYVGANALGTYLQGTSVRTESPLYDNAVTSKKSIDPHARGLYDATGAVKTVDYGAYALNDQSGIPAFNWASRYFQNSGGGITLDYENLQLMDGNPIIENPVLDWLNGILYDAMVTESMDWKNRLLKDTMGTQAINYATRILYASDGIDPVLNFSTAGLADFGNSKIDTTDTVEGGIVNATTGFKVNGVATTAKVLQGNGTNYVASTVTFPTAISDTYIPVSTGSNVINSDAGLTYNDSTDILSVTSIINATTGFRVNGVATSGKVLLGNGTNLVLSPYTLPTTAAGSSGKVLQSNGTNWVASSVTFPSTVTAGRIAYGSAANTIGESANLTYVASPSSYMSVIGDVRVNSDAYGVVLGAGQDAEISYDGTDLVINPKAVGTGKVSVSGAVNTVDSSGGITYSAFLSDASQGGAGVFTDGTYEAYLADTLEAGYFGDGVNDVSLANGTYAIQTTGDVDITGDLNVTGNEIVNGSLTVDGNVYYKMPHLFGIADTNQNPNAINTWKAIDFNFLKGDSYGFSANDSNGIIVTQTGHYFATFEVQFIDSSASPNADVGLRITLNGSEIEGSYSETGSNRQDADFQLTTIAYIEANEGDILQLEWITSDIDVNVQSKNVWATSPVNAKGFINWVHN